MAIPQKLHWNGSDLPDTLRDLPPGNYVIESVDDVPALSIEEDAGIEAALASDPAKDRTLEQVKHKIDAILRR